jgi:hypothetical protein
MSLTLDVDIVNGQIPLRNVIASRRAYLAGRLLKLDAALAYLDSAEDPENDVVKVIKALLTHEEGG